MAWLRRAFPLLLEDGTPKLLGASREAWGGTNERTRAAQTTRTNYGDI